MRVISWSLVSLAFLLPLLLVLPEIRPVSLLCIDIFFIYVPLLMLGTGVLAIVLYVSGRFTWGTLFWLMSIGLLGVRQFFFYRLCSLCYLDGFNAF